MKPRGLEPRLNRREPGGSSLTRRLKLDTEKKGLFAPRSVDTPHFSGLAVAQASEEPCRVS